MISGETTANWRVYRPGILVPMLLLALFCTGLQGQSDKPPEDLVKAAFLVNFCKFIEWPEGAFDSNQDDIVIAIFDPSAMPNVFRGDTPEVKVRDQRVVFIPFDLPGADTRPHMVFVNTTSSRTAKRVLGQFAGKPVLTVGESPEFTEWGGMIALTQFNARIRFEINLEKCKEEGFWLSSQLLSLGKVVLRNVEARPILAKSPSEGVN